LALDQIGQDAVDAKIGVEPSGEASNEISVDETTKKPKNPMINAGAIAAVSLIPARSPQERFDMIAEFYSAFAGRRLELDRDVYASERATGSRNRAIAYMLQSSGCSTMTPTRSSTSTSASARSTSRRPTWPGWRPRSLAAG
jgi:glutaminase